MSEKKILSLLREKGYKLTPQRKAIMKTIFLSPHHLSPADIYRKVSKIYRGIGLVTVYRTLEILIKLGLVCEVHTEKGTRRYILRESKKHHHHLICTECGRVVYFLNCNLENLASRLSRETKFEIKSHSLEFFGRCSECQKRLTKTLK